MLFVEGNIFNSPAQTLVNTVNTVGAMGKGLAKEFKRLFPEMFKEYQQLCERGEFTTGKLWIYHTPNKSVLSFPTKQHWRQPSRLEWIERGLATFVANYERLGLRSVAFPQLGCGNGELEWQVVKPLMEKHLRKLPIDIFVYEIDRFVSPEHKELKEMRLWLISEPVSLPFEEFKTDLLGLSKASKHFEDSTGEAFEVFEEGDRFCIRQHGVLLSAPWRGDDVATGWLELWQFIRDKGVCQTQDLVQMGFSLSDAVISLMLKLEYVRPLIVLGTESSPALQLRPVKIERDLFSSEVRPNNRLQI